MGSSQVVCLDDFPKACDNVGPSLSVCSREVVGGGWQLYPGRSHQFPQPPPPTLQPPGEQERKENPTHSQYRRRVIPSPLSLSVCSRPPTSLRSPHYFPIKTAAHPPTHLRTSSWYTLHLKRFFLVRLFLHLFFFFLQRFKLRLAD